MAEQSGSGSGPDLPPSVPTADSRLAPPGVDPELHVVAHLIHAEFDDHLDSRAVDECLSQVAARFDGASIRSFVPLFVRRYAREQLQQQLRRQPDLPL